MIFCKVLQLSHLINSANCLFLVLGSKIWFWNLSSEFWVLVSWIYNGSDSKFWILALIRVLGLSSEFDIHISKFIIDCFWFINENPAIIQSFFVLLMAKNLLKESPVFFKASDLAKYLFKDLPVFISYYILL